MRVNRVESNATIQKISDRLSVWLLVGNAAGLLFCFNAVLEHRICDWEAFRGTAILFGLGALGILLGHAFTALGHSLAVAIDARQGLLTNLDVRSARLERAMSRVFAFLRDTVMWLAVVGFMLGFAMLIVAPLGFILSPNSPAMLCTATS